MASLALSRAPVWTLPETAATARRRGACEQWRASLTTPPAGATSFGARKSLQQQPGWHTTQQAPRRGSSVVTNVCLRSLHNCLVWLEWIGLNLIEMKWIRVGLHTGFEGHCLPWGSDFHGLGNSVPTGRCNTAAASGPAVIFVQESHCLLGHVFSPSCHRTYNGRASLPAIRRPWETYLYVHQFHRHY